MAQTVGGVFQPSQDQQFGGGVLTDCSTSQLGVGYTTAREGPSLRPRTRVPQSP